MPLLTRSVHNFEYLQPLFLQRQIRMSFSTFRNQAIQHISLELLSILIFWDLLLPFNILSE